jgi:hypothetical protein
MPRTAAPRYVQAREPATGTFDGEQFVLKPGEILAADHPIARAYPEFFKALEPSRQRPEVEQMTAGPGEKRGQR